MGATCISLAVWGLASIHQLTIELADGMVGLMLAVWLCTAGSHAQLLIPCSMPTVTLNT